MEKGATSEALYDVISDHWGENGTGYGVAGPITEEQYNDAMELREDVKDTIEHYYRPTKHFLSKYAPKNALTNQNSYRALPSPTGYSKPVQTGWQMSSESQ